MPWPGTVVVLLCGGLVLGWLAAARVHGQSYDDQAWRIAQELQCPICQGQSVAESNSQLAIQMRGLIREKLANGESREEIMAFFVARYGENVLLAPPARGFAALAWVAPYVGLLAALGFLTWVIRRQRTPVAPAEAGPDDAYLSQVDREFDRLRDGPLR